MRFAKQTMGMRMLLLLAMSGGAISAGIAVAPSQTAFGDRAGSLYELTKYVETASEGDGGSTSSSTDRDTIAERILHVRNDGLELEYDLPKDATKQDRTSNWQFPIRVFKRFSGPAQLLNRPEIEGRIERWLRAGNISRAACGHWVFTWNAFKIDCDPQSALATVAAYDLGPNDLRDGFIYGDPQAAGPITLRKTGTGAATFSGSMPVDPANVRREQAETDVAIAEISKRPLTLDDAVRARSGEKVAGSISISFDVDPSGFVRQRTTIVKLEIIGADGKMEHRTATEILKRQVVPSEGRRR